MRALGIHRRAMKLAAVLHKASIEAQEISRAAQAIQVSCKVRDAEFATPMSYNAQRLSGELLDAEHYAILTAEFALSLVENRVQRLPTSPTGPTMPATEKESA